MADNSRGIYFHKAEAVPLNKGHIFAFYRTFSTSNFISNIFQEKVIFDKKTTLMRTFDTVPRHRSFSIYFLKRRRKLYLSEELFVKKKFPCV